ncbi:MAG TPA: endonuclease domain-containing protein [Candidatus Acidoferrales bacterium]|nr:endonuclease domain-containing protein [Candidatus Acidoferrales bacterium]
MPNTPEVKARRAAQARARRQNPEVRERERAANRKYHITHRDQRLAYHKAYNAKPENQERRRAYGHTRRQQPGYYQKNQARQNELNRARREALAGRPQPELCDVCGRPEPHKDGTVFDHCHKNGHFRGWLCRNCNWILGLANDNPEILIKLASYLYTR